MHFPKNWYLRQRIGIVPFGLLPKSATSKSDTVRRLTWCSISGPSCDRTVPEPHLLKPPGLRRWWHTLYTFGRLDYAVNNAGIEGQITSITELAKQEWDRVIDTNLKGTFLCLQHEARAMLAGGRGGAIVNVGSVNSFLGFAFGAGYCASNHGLIGLTTRSECARFSCHGAAPAWYERQEPCV